MTRTRSQVLHHKIMDPPKNPIQMKKHIKRAYRPKFLQRYFTQVQLEHKGHKTKHKKQKMTTSILHDLAT